MTTTLFATILIISSLLIFSTVSLLMIEFIGSESVGFGVGIGATILFVVLFINFTPSMEQIVENDYYAMMENRPKCIDAGDVSLGCKKAYIEWQKDSIEKQHKYDSVKVKLDNLQKEILK